jgi:hypothetical protein
LALFSKINELFVCTINNYNYLPNLEVWVAPTKTPWLIAHRWDPPCRDQWRSLYCSPQKRHTHSMYPIDKQREINSPHTCTQKRIKKKC